MRWILKYKNTLEAMFRMVCMLIFFFVFSTLQAQELETLVDLRGYWKFNIGDNPEWAEPSFNDSQWEEIRVPGNWESQGFNGYDGYAWYRTTATLPSGLTQGTLYLKLGYIDDVDEVFINGIRIGQTGQFPPDYSTAFRADRLYIIPRKIELENGKISIAVRVFDEGGEGGFIHGDIAIVADLSSVHVDFDLQGDWYFKTGDCASLPEANEFRNWGKISVPGTWEDQGYKDYDGIACYAAEFELDGKFANQRMVLMLGRIDDLDMVYLNDELIGQSGEFSAATVWKRSDAYKQVRGYYIPQGLLKTSGLNTLVVKVLDVGGLGGIWDGSIGLITQDHYIQYWREKRKSMR